MDDAIELTSATHPAVNAAWIAGAVAVAYGLGLAVSWLPLRLGHRSEVMRDVAQLTRVPLCPTPTWVAASLVRVRMLVSAPDAGAVLNLRCDIREGMVAWLQRTSPGALPRQRIEHQSQSGPTAQSAGNPRDSVLARMRYHR